MLKPTGALDTWCHVKEVLRLPAATLSSDSWVVNMEELVKYLVLERECVCYSQVCDRFGIAIF